MAINSVLNRPIYLWLFQDHKYNGAVVRNSIFMEFQSLLSLAMSSCNNISVMADQMDSQIGGDPIHNCYTKGLWIHWQVVHLLLSLNFLKLFHATTGNSTIKFFCQMISMLLTFISFHLPMEWKRGTSHQTKLRKHSSWQILLPFRFQLMVLKRI